MAGHSYVLQFAVLVWFLGQTNAGQRFDCNLKGREVNRSCEHEGKVDGILFKKNTNYDKVPRRVKLSCSDGSKVLNIPPKTKFQCCKGKEDVIYRWHSTKDINFVADNATLECQVKKECIDPPPKPGNNMYRDEISRYIKPTGAKGKLKYYDGDEYMYGCKQGLCNDDWNQNVQTRFESNSDYDYYDQFEDTTAVCNGSSGKWDVGDLPTCQAIRCDASRFGNVTNGMILNYTEIYEYGEYMELRCDDGYATTDGVHRVKCEQGNSFDNTSLKNFQCEEIRCPEPPEIMNGNAYGSNRSINSTILFGCETGYTLSGQETWRCMGNGKWDGYCARCNRDNTYCPAPCVPEKAILVNPLPKYDEGVVIEFECKENITYGGSRRRECLRNRQWSGDPIDCTGGRYRSAIIGNLKHTLENISATNEQTNDNNSDNVEVGGKAFEVGNVGGVDGYMMFDVSGSIDDSEFNAIKRLINGLLPPLNISNTAFGTRLAMFAFGSEVHTIDNDHDFGELSLEDWETKVQNMDKEDVASKTKKGTAMYEALYEVREELRTKQARWNKGEGRLNAQQVLLIISDGINNGGGDISKIAEELKSEKYNLQIISVCIQFDTKTDSNGVNLMETLASEPKYEHSFLIKSKDRDMTDIIDSMISKEDVCVLCGCTKPQLSDYKSNNHYKKARKSGWPWMAQLKREDHRGSLIIDNMDIEGPNRISVTDVFDGDRVWFPFVYGANGEHFCGGSIVDRHWILTAAHCFDEGNILHTIDLNRQNADDDNEHGVLELKDLHLFKHPKYNKDVEPHYLYDMALIYTPEEIPFSSEIHAVCLNTSGELSESATGLTLVRIYIMMRHSNWTEYIIAMIDNVSLCNHCCGVYLLHNQLVNSADPDETTPAGAVSSGSSLFTVSHYEEVFKDDNNQYGVVTGWGKENHASQSFAKDLKQMTMKIQNNKTCLNMVKDQQKSHTYNSSLMFCAGGKSETGAVIDTCKGDSGGPFVVAYPDDQPGKEDHFVQLGIVSSGIGKCKQDGVYGYYTKLTPENRDWIYETMKTKPQ